MSRPVLTFYQNVYVWQYINILAWRLLNGWTIFEWKKGVANFMWYVLTRLKIDAQ